MDILNSGSFVALDNREKIEQLIHTAKELADAASKTEGFVHAGDSNQRLSLDMWQGAEYMTRAHEEATIKNIFLSNFLQRLAEINRAKTALQAATATPPAAIQPPTAMIEPMTATIEVNPESPGSSDEYLGVVADDAGTNSVAETTSYYDECVPEGEREIVEFSIEGDIVDDAAKPEAVESVPSEPTETIMLEPTPSTPVASQISEVEPQVVTNQAAMDPERKPEAVQPPDPPQITTKPSVERIVLAEKEPYNLDSCTVTAVVQMLPVADEKRKCVISVRTHDFAPQVTISELPTPIITGDLSSELQNAISWYQADLPARSAEKLKKEKSNGKKRAVKPADKTKPAVKSAGAAASAPAGATSQPATSTAGQSNLFGS